MQNLTQKVGSAFDLAMNRKPEMQYFHMQTQFIHLGFDGQRQGTETYLLTLWCIPAALSGEKLDHYTCGEFGLQLNSGNVVTIPDLHLWDYDFNPLMTGIDGNGPMFGIPHEIFEDTKDSEGNELPPDVRYAIYNNFIDFHALNDAFSRPMFGKGGDALKFIGDKIVHPAAFTEAPVSVGTTVKPGSVFRNGEVTLEFKGVSRVDEECLCIDWI